MKLPVETISGTIWAGVIIAIILGLVVSLIPGVGWMIASAIVLLLWLILFGLLSGPTPAR
jgi:uncharacterized membrane protein